MLPRCKVILQRRPIDPATDPTLLAILPKGGPCIAADPGRSQHQASLTRSKTISLQTSCLPLPSTLHTHPGAVNFEPRAARRPVKQHACRQPSPAARQAQPGLAVHAFERLRTPKLTALKQILYPSGPVGYCAAANGRAAAVVRHAALAERAQADRVQEADRTWDGTRAGGLEVRAARLASAAVGGSEEEEQAQKRPFREASLHMHNGNQVFMLKHLCS